MAKEKKIKFTIKKYKIEKAPVGTRFIQGGHSTLLIVTDGKEISNISKNIICVSESGLLRKIPFGTEIEGIKEAKEIFTITSGRILNIYHKKNG
jgi:hypothetical protein